MSLLIGRRMRLASIGATLALVAAACSAPPVQWTSSRSIASVPGVAVTLGPTGTIVADTLASLATRVAPPPGPVCPGSLRLARSGATLFAAWWAPRADSSASLVSARSTDGGHGWSVPVPVDSTDHAVNGCRRVPPAIAADSASGYVHVTYAMLASEGPGLFFSHSMDGGASFHAPVPIMYGDRLGRTSVAADGALVIVGFEDPNSATPRIGVAISSTMGHIFEDRILPVSDDNGAATHPYVAVRGRNITVAWEQRATRDTPSAPAALVLRAGVVR